MKKISLIFFIAIGLLLTKMASASTMIFAPAEKQVGLHEQFYLDLMLDPEGVSINGIEGQITFPSEYLTFIRAEEAKSMIDLWVQPPTLTDNGIKFMGMIPGGFDGVIDPFNQEHKLPGLMVRFIFEPIKSGQVAVTTPAFNISLNNGLGTIQNISPTSANIIISDKENKVTYENKSNLPPELEAFVDKSPDLFNNKFTLIFKATDKNSGIKEVLIKEGHRKWESITSPYLLKDQSRHSIILLQAVNYSGFNTVVKIDPIPEKFSIIYFVLLLILIVILFFVFKKGYVNKNKK
jgi:hypothetical protein